MIAPLFRIDKPHFHTNGGALACGWKLKTFKAGTDIPVQLYKDAEGKEKYPVEIVLNNRGEVDGAGIFGMSETRYKIVFENAAGKRIWSLDNVSAGSETGGQGKDGFALVEANEVFGSQRLPEDKYNLISTMVENDRGVSLISGSGSNSSVFTLASIGSTGLTFFNFRNGKVTLVKISPESSSGYHAIDVDQIDIGGKGGLERVEHDDSLSGDGTADDPLKVVGGGDKSYESGDGIYIDGDNVINILAGMGLEFDDGNRLKVKLGKGLKFDTEAGIEGEIAIDDIGLKVIEEVQELANELDKKITTTFNYAQIKDMQDFALYGVQGTTRLIGQLFAVPIATEIRKNETLLNVRALQNYSGKVSFGIFEFDFDGNEGQGSTTWLCDTGVVSINAGENQMPVRHVKSTSATEPKIKMIPGKLYYATILIAGDAPATGLMLAADEPYESNYNATPKYTMIASNMDNYVDWTNGSQEATWFQGYNEFHNVPRLFMMIRNGEMAPIPTSSPFDDYNVYSLSSVYKIGDLFSLPFTVDNQPVLYQKIIPRQDCVVTNIGWAGTSATPFYEFATDVPLIIDSDYNKIKEVGDAIFSLAPFSRYNLYDFALNEPLALKAGTIYFVPCNLIIVGGTDEPLLTFNRPADIQKDLLLFDSKYNVASWAGTHKEYISSQPAPMCQIKTDDGKTYTF